ncbi:tol-pal system protein YbgF [Pseudodesulfovibrio sp. F-1]|uniref:Tol-pal system protein YbgF n=1 Tax=Pseudodesulfovibrio alkaliphilus TaxID=2661613 RepID=A0A7K1KRS6_9BACT|nr:tol-pal system protein YbgF [Pseudodesulfovibrio alkaliphilus]MUM78803.1 tol-pal system protein YbgF [Pseudodesulfovibrio alkaliphilus]
MKYITLGLFVACSLLAGGCTAARQNAATTEASTEWRIKSLEESFLNFREEQRRQADVNAETAEAMDRRLASIEADLAVLRGGEVVVPASGRTVPSGTDESHGHISEPDDIVPEGEGWVSDAPLAEASPMPPVAESDEDKPWATVPGPPAVIPEPTVIERPAAPSAAKTPARTPSRSQAPVAGAQALYDAALAKYNSGDFVGSRTAFDEFLAKYPNHALAPNSLYWKGETYYSQKDYAQAILTFREVTSRFPKHAKAASALLKTGMSYDRVGDRDNAVFYLRALIEDFPASAPAALGRRELSRLGG